MIRQDFEASVTFRATQSFAFKPRNVIPAVQKVRESANVLRCQSNLRQIAIAYHNYHDVYSFFPMHSSNATATLGTNGVLALGWSSLLFAYPFLEEDGTPGGVDWPAPQNLVHLIW